MKKGTSILGIDAGSISVSVALIGPDGTVLDRAYETHRGDIRGIIARILSRIIHSPDPVPQPSLPIARTSSTPDLIEGARVVDNRVAFITAARHFHPKVGSILVVGGEKFGLATFSADGEYRNYRGNTSCAAGTGSFLDQQAARLNIESVSEFARLAYENTGEVPRIASRCSVFAKTDLIHAQQEGYRISEICDGSCYGLAKNIADTLFVSDDDLREPVLFVGGVSRNKAVARHLSTLAGKPLTVHPDAPLFGAIGAALSLRDEIEHFSAELPAYNDTGAAGLLARPEPSPEAGPFPGGPVLLDPDRMFRETRREKRYHHPPLNLGLSGYPDFSSRERFEYLSGRFPGIPAVETDIYEELAGMEIPVYLGVDIGSTSTKGVLLGTGGEVLAGFYTRTAGKPVEAVQAILETIDLVSREKGIGFAVRGFGTTGSGRSFIGSIFGADVVLDEISAHARAAYEIDPETDTIIEIGGQDSKFTTMRNGMVTMAVMNTVCAAGTGSFIEEQAKRLSCPLSEYAARVDGVPAPLSSDRCTVFMERDITGNLSEGYAVNEILASVLHSICANYLCKVAVEHRIGNRIFFQGATAKNKALVAAFEQRLGKPITVSRFCHLTGAIGAALQLVDEAQAAGGTHSTKFGGISLYRSEIPVRQEICGLCANHCKLKIAVVDGQETAFGFLCGRDYETKKRVPLEAARFDPSAVWARLFTGKGNRISATGPVIGIPAALHLFEEVALWKRFFRNLAIPVIDSSSFRDGLKEGKRLTGAEFCAPVTALHGHVAHLIDAGADYIFLPVSLETIPGGRGRGRNYCYYTQFAPSVVSLMKKVCAEDRLLLPLLKSVRGSFHAKMELYQTLKRLPGFAGSILQVFSALEDALRFHDERLEKFRSSYSLTPESDIRVALLGRPYTVLDQGMNAGIPGIFARLGIRTYSGDMIPSNPESLAKIAPLLSALNWEFASRILEEAQTVADTEGLYPVFITSFKCSPDSFALEYFRKIMEAADKPYLVLQLDEHDSSLGYQTRIEAGIRSFRNHLRTGGVRAAAEPITCAGSTPPASAVPHAQFPLLRVNPDITDDLASLRGRILLLPNWDSMIGRLLEANLQSEGIDARLLPETDQTIREGLSRNTGQCLPLNTITQGCISFIEKNGLDPARTALWMPDSELSCNFRMFPYYIKELLERHGKGLEKTAVYLGDILFLDISAKAGVTSYFAYMFGGYLRKLACKVRPYEIEKGETDRVTAESLDLLSDLFLHKRFRRDGGEVIESIVTRFQGIPVRPGKRPLVAIFGDIYVRDNEVMNQGLVRTIEDAGGEAIVTPYSEFIKAISGPYFHRWFTEGKYIDVATSKILMRLALALERKYRRLFNRILDEPEEFPTLDPREILGKYRVRMDHTGESMENLMKTAYLARLHSDISLFIQASPAFCCPSIVTRAMADRIEEVTGIPVLSIEYDGTGAFKNGDLVPYLKFPRGKTPDRPAPRLAQQGRGQ